MGLLPGTDSITSLLTSFLDVQSRRTETVASNLANAETPGYKARELDFSDFLRRAARESIAPQASGGDAGSLVEQPRVVFQLDNTTRMDGNNVDTGREMATLAEAGTQYLTGVQLLQSRLRTLRTAIREGK